MVTTSNIDAADHPLAADFVALNDPARRREVERRGDYFVVEGVLAIERLLALPDWNVRTLLLLPAVAERLASSIDRARVRHADLTVAVADEDVLRAVVGFDLHRGALASVDRRPPTPLADVVRPGGLLLVAEGVNDHENLGSLYRNAAAFGADAVVLDPTCADPFYRRSVRVSLGHVLGVPTVRTGAFPTGLGELHERGVTTIALSPRADVELVDLDRSMLGPGPAAVVVGAEGPGLTDGALASSMFRASISMAEDVDSLNVATAAAIALHHLRQHRSVVSPSAR